MERLQRTRLLSAGVLGVVLATGVVLGLAVDTLTSDPPPEAPARGDRERGERDRSRGEERRDRRVPLYRQVGELTDEQETRIDGIIEIHRDSLRTLQGEFEDFRERYNSRFAAIVDDTRESIKTVLTPTQAVRYDSLLADFDRTRRRDSDADRRDGASGRRDGASGRRDGAPGGGDEAPARRDGGPEHRE